MSPTKAKIKRIFSRIMIVIAILLLGWVLAAPHFMTFRMSDEEALRLFSASRIPASFRDLQIGNRKIHFVMVGNDSLPTLVFIHGSPSSWNAFFDYLKDPDLIQHYRMVSIDRPGFGNSGFGEATDLTTQTQLLIPVIKSIHNGKPLYLAGHSLGGPLVIKLAADDPAEINGIMLIAGSVDPGLEPREGWRKIFERMPLCYLLPGAFRPSNTELVYFKRDVIQLARDFSKVTCPVYLVHGDKDSWVPPGNVEYARKKLVRASLVVTLMLPGGNHFIPWTRKKEIVMELLKMGRRTP